MTEFIEATPAENSRGSLDKIKKVRGLTDEQLNNTKKYEILLRGSFKPNFQYSGRSLSSLLESLNTDPYIYIGDTIYSCVDIRSIRRVED